MKKELTKALIFWGIAILLLFALSPIAGAENLYGSVIRIHVLANSDSEEDQALKFMVRDRLLEYSNLHFSDLGDKEKAEREIKKNLDEMKKEAESALREEGCEFPVEVVLTEEYYPTREYESFSLPAGNYLSLQVKIGEAQGQNWWCVLFPPICTSTALNTEAAFLEAGMNEENIKTVTVNGDEYAVRFKILEIWEGTREKLNKLF